MSAAPDTPLRGAQVTVTGATGFSGSRLVHRLIERGARVRAIARPGSRVDRLGGLPIDWIRGQVFDDATVAEAVAGAEYIFHLAAAYREARASADTYRRVHVVSTQKLAEAASTSPVLKRFVHVSTIGVHGHIAHPPAVESSPFNPDDEYQRTKAEAETWLRQFAASRGLPLTVLRPCAIYGPGDTRLLKLFRMAARGLFPLLGSGRGLYHLIHVDDLVEVLMLAAVSPKALGEVFIVGNPDSITLEHLGRVAGRALGRQVRVIRLPAWPFFAAAAVCEAVCTPFGVEPPLYRRRVAFYTKDRSFETRKLREVLGYTVRWSNDEGLTETARWYVEQGWISPPR
ncbi:MAG: NAD-dependent epimerase/dehydratase family protein [Gemmatimonadetes bacterium]|nr:NAD-dependent epimerase/dehydratase family protein [Gemmatimonadota bacterium]